jgi:hypothetical protein
MGTHIHVCMYSSRNSSDGRITDYQTSWYYRLTTKEIGVSKLVGYREKGVVGLKLFCWRILYKGPKCNDGFTIDKVLTEKKPHCRWIFSYKAQR